VETLTDLYVVEPFQPGRNDSRLRLVGVLSLRALVRARPDRRIADIMETDVISVQVDTDQEEVARIISKYDFLAVPVLDRDGALVGIVTVDDVVDVLMAEQTEDVLALGAVAASEVPYLATGVISTVRQRFGWLLLLFVAETATGTVLRHFERAIAVLPALAFFVPLLIGSGGNAGAQTVTTITRALALGEVRFNDWLRVFWRESRVGLMIGTFLAVISYFRALLWNTTPNVAQVVALSLILIVIWANMVGSLLPIAAKRLGFDPAVMSAPFITTLVDATGLFIYFSLARLLLNL
jgi:magnesium transporter